MSIIDSYDGMSTLERIHMIADGDDSMARALIRQAIIDGFLETKTIKYWMNRLKYG